MTTCAQEDAGLENSGLEGKTALVVGGSGGIGACVSARLAARGARLIVHGKSKATVDAVVDSIRASGGLADGFPFVIESPGAFIEALEARFGEDFAPAFLAVCFGPFERKSLAGHSFRDWERLALLDLALPGALASRFISPMMASGYGRFLFFGGTRTDAIRGYTSNAPYAAAKTGLGVLAKSIAIEGADRNVAAVVVCPGLVDTEYLGPEAKESLIRIAPGGRLIDPDQLARAALDLIDRDPCIASGAVVALDGGFSP